MPCRCTVPRTWPRLSSAEDAGAGSRDPGGAAKSLRNRRLPTTANQCRAGGLLALGFTRTTRSSRALLLPALIHRYPTMSRIRTIAGVALASALALPAALRAQDSSTSTSNGNPFGPGGRLGVSINGLYAAPQDEFKSFV